VKAKSYRQLKTPAAAGNSVSGGGVAWRRLAHRENGVGGISAGWRRSKWHLA
jgi:hypothetical protein